MAKLAPEKQIHLTQKNISLICATYGISDFAFEPINQGIENSSARIESNNKKYVLRVYIQGKKDEDILLEINFQDYLREHNIPIPLIYKNSDGQELNIVEIDSKRWQTILMDLVEGQSVTENPSFELIADLAHLQAKMHLLGIEYTENNKVSKEIWTELRDSHASKVEHTTVGGKEAQDLIKRIKAYNYKLDSDLPYGYNHLDIDFDGNVITKDNKVSGIIDFDDLAYSPIIVCLGYSLWNILDDNGIDAMKHYLREYEKVRPLSPLEYEALRHVVYFRNYVIAIIRLLLWDADTRERDIVSLIKLEKEIPNLLDPINLKH